MAAIACLRVLLDGNRTDVPAEALGPLVAKYANIFLEVRWTFPRLSEQLNFYAYKLTDPRAEALDTVELAHLSQELQERLFGTGVEDAVKLMLFEGDADAIDAFAGYSADDVLAAMQDPSALPPGGRLRRIAADGSLVDVPEAPVSVPAAEALRFGPTVDGAQGVYFPVGQAFIGDVLSCTPVGAATYYSMVDGDEHRPDDAEAFDAACVMTALRYLVDFQVTAQLFVPISFSTLVRPSARAAWLELAFILPPEMRNRLSASVYDVPRSPTYQALSTVTGALDATFGAVDLCTRDPDFQIQQLGERAVTSVTLMLPDAKPDVRLAALRRFASHGHDYRRRKIAAGVTNIRFRAERELAIELRIAFLSGPGICRIQSEPVGGRSWPIAALPLLSLHSPVLAAAG
ncbi:hypothetical protein [Brevundimonas sp.]|jgi:hypothetical protein|uniref:hypothetical protein n=1 Tax=Brevundimonas sp. TaxID=1871086 RepID=UPI0037849FF0